MNSIKKTNIIASLGLILAMLALFVGPLVEFVYAAALLDKHDTLTTVKITTVADHDIIFRTPTGVGDSSDTIIIDFGVTNTTWDTGSIVFGDVDLAHSAGSQADCDAPTFTNEEVLAATATASDWGFAVNTSTDVITLTAPTDGVGVAAIATDACVQIQIGTNASGGSNQIINATSAQSYTINIAGAFGDDGDIVVTLITDDVVAVSGTVDESLTFALGSNSLALGTLSSSAVQFSTHTMNVATNASSGMAVTVSGATLTFGGNTIDACASGCSSTTGTEQFGINLKDNTTPNVGVEATGSAPIGVAATDYDTADTFRFATGEVVASSTAGINDTTFTISYIANISGATEAGSYTANLTYIATATF